MEMGYYGGLLIYEPVISVTGLGYVGLPVAIALAKKWPVIGFDINTKRIDELLEGVDQTGEVESAELALVGESLKLTACLEELKKANFSYRGGSYAH